MSKFFRQFSIAAVACTAWCWIAPRVSADEVASDDATRAAARQLGEEGVEAYWAGDNEQAHAKLERAYQLFSAPTLALWSARACVRVGRWVEAAERYREVTRPSSS